MKANFFTTLATLAVSAFAAPQVPAAGSLVPGNPLGGLGGGNAPSVPGGIGGGEAPAVPAAPAVPGDVSGEAPSAPEDIGGVDGLIVIITGLTGDLTTGFGNIGDLAGQVDSGDSTPEEVQPTIVNELLVIQLNLERIVTQLTGQAGIPVAGTDVDRLVAALDALVNVLLANVTLLVTILGISPELISILHSVFILLSNVLVLVTGIVIGVVPGLLISLAPLLAALGNGVLAPLLAIVAGLVAGLAGI